MRWGKPPKRLRGRAGTSILATRTRWLWLLLILLLLLGLFGVRGYQRQFAPSAPTAESSAMEIPPRPPLAGADGGPLPEAAVIEMRTEMFDTAEQLVRDLPGPDALCLLGTVHHLCASDAVAQSLWKRCLEIDPQFADAHHALGTWLLSRGDFAGAETNFRAALRIDPVWDEIPLPLDKALQGQGKFRESIDVLEPYVANRPSNAEAWHRLGMAYQQTGDFENARRSHQQAVDLHPTFTPAHHGLATALKKLGRIEEAQAHDRQFHDLMEADKRQEKTLREDLGDQQRIRYRLVHTRLTAARVYLKHDRAEEAEAQWRRVAQLEPTDRESREGLCELMTRQSRIPEAAALRKELVQLDPDSTRQLLSLGALQFRSQQFAEADATYRRVIALAPRQPNGYAGLAQVQMSPGRNREEAVAMARQAVALEPTAAHHYILGIAQQNCGDVAAARAALQEASRLDPSAAIYRQALVRLEMAQQQ